MSINHFSSDLPETHWWTQQQQPSIMDNNTSPSSKPHYLPPHQLYHNNINNPSQQHYLQPSNWLNSDNPQHSTSIPMYQSPNNNLNFNLNQQDYNDEDLDDQIITDSATELNNHQDQQQDLEKEPMFEKPLTPSDVGKLNRLVIPKQHAEKYFPLGGGGGDSSSVDKGLLLSFEDELGKFWRFRYSYWNSSQSYVLTKGWSRYVKEKRLDAGDVVLFERHRTDTERLFIGWRRRAAPGSGPAVAQVNGGESTGGWTRMLYSAHPYPTHPHHPHHHHHAVPYQPDCLHAGSPAQNQTAPVGNSRILRLFGVNMECQPDESEPSTPDGSSFSSQGPTHQHFYPPHYSDHMDFTCSRDVKPMRNRRG